MATFWDERRDTVVQRPGKAREAMKLIISEAHTLTIALAAPMDAIIDGEDEVRSESKEDDDYEVQDGDAEQQVCSPLNGSVHDTITDVALDSCGYCRFTYRICVRRCWYVLECLTTGFKG